MNIFDFLDYKSYINSFVKSLPNKGRGEYGRLAKAANISSTLISQIFNGNRDLTLEQVFLICEYLNLNVEESEYFETLVLLNRSGLEKQKEHYRKKIKNLKAKNKSFQKHINPKKLELSPQEEITYYTEWIHSAVRLLGEIKAFQNIEGMSEKLKVEVKMIKESAEFLKKTGLIEYNNGVIKGLEKNIHQEKSSHLNYLRQLSWRMKALENFQRKNESDFFFNALMTIKKSQLEKIKTILKEGLGSVGKEVDETTKPDEMMCLNIDFFKV